jgi:hypothetical protein
MARDDDAPDPVRIMILARQAMSSAEIRKKLHLIDFWGEREFYAAAEVLCRWREVSPAPGPRRQSDGQKLLGRDIKRRPFPGQSMALSACNVLQCEAGCPRADRCSSENVHRRQRKSGVPNKNVGGLAERQLWFSLAAARI